LCRGLIVPHGYAGGEFAKRSTIPEKPGEIKSLSKAFVWFAFRRTGPMEAAAVEATVSFLKVSSGWQLSRGEKLVTGGFWSTVLSD